MATNPREKALGRRGLRRFLQEFSKDQLIDEIVELTVTFPHVREFYQSKVNPADDSPVREKYKKSIRNEFFPDRGFGKARLSVARKAVTDYAKVAASVDGIADVMLWYVESGVEFTADFGDIGEAFYLSMERMYGSVLEHLAKHDLVPEFVTRCWNVVTKSSGVGYGFHDTLHELYDTYVGEDVDQVLARAPNT